MGLRVVALAPALDDEGRGLVILELGHGGAAGGRLEAMSQDSSPEVNQVEREPNTAWRVGEGTFSSHLEEVS